MERAEGAWVVAVLVAEVRATEATGAAVEAMGRA